MTNYPLKFTRKYLGIGLKGDFDIGSVKNNYLLGVDKNWYNYDLSRDPLFNWNGTGNIFHRQDWPNPGISHHKAKHNRDTRMTGWHIVDTIKAANDRLNITLGLHGHKAQNTPVGAKTQESDAICPTFAVSYKTSPNVTVYAAHTESFGMGSMVSTTGGYKNGGEVLDPTKTKQNEIGVKVKSGTFMNSLSLFQIKKANYIDKFVGTDKYYTSDGEQKHTGVEWATTGRLSDKLDLIGGVMYLNAKQEKTSNGLYDGDRVNGAAKWNATMGAIYHPVKDFDILGRINYGSSSTVNNGNLHVPSFFTLDLGASYKTKINNTPVTFTAMCYNLTGKDYYLARSGNSSLTVGAPRTITLSAEFAF